MDANNAPIPRNSPESHLEKRRHFHVSADMPRIGLEPTRLAAPEPKSGMSTNFTTWAERIGIF